jgi:hypothetical protein
MEPATYNYVSEPKSPPDLFGDFDQRKSVIKVIIIRLLTYAMPYHLNLPSLSFASQYTPAVR